MDIHSHIYLLIDDTWATSSHFLVLIIATWYQLQTYNMSTSHRNPQLFNDHLIIINLPSLFNAKSFISLFAFQLDTRSKVSTEIYNICILKHRYLGWRPHSYWCRSQARLWWWDSWSWNVRYFELLNFSLNKPFNKNQFM